MQINNPPPATHSTPPAAPALSPPPPAPQIDALLRAAPNGQTHMAPTTTLAPNVDNAQAPGTVQQPGTANATLNRLRTLTSKESIEKMLREPKSQETAQQLVT